MRRLPASLRKALDESGLPWALVLGSKHLQLRIDGRLVAILPRGTGLRKECSRNAAGVVTAIRRFAREGRVS